MPFEAREVLTVRGNEIGSSGVIPPGTLARYCEWARWAMFRGEASELRGRFHGGVARAQTFEIEGDLTYPSDCAIESHVARVGRTSFDFGHVLRRVEDDVVVARARVTIVALGPTGPTPVDPGLAALVDPRPAPAPLVHPGEAPADAYQFELLARPSDQDQFRHVNQARYVDFADDARQLASRAGHPAGFDGPVGRVSVDYLREVHAGDRIDVRLWRGEGATRALELRNAATGVVVHRSCIEPR